MDFNIIMYIVFGVLAVAGGAALFIAKHPIRGAMGLLGSMLSLAGMYAMLNAHAIAAFQVIIYAGAVMVLIVYIIMLLDIRTADFLTPFSRYFVWGVPIMVILLVIFMVQFLKVNPGELETVTAGNSAIAEFGTVNSLGSTLLNENLFAFEYVSTLLFAAIVAVIALVQLDWKGRKK